MDEIFGEENFVGQFVWYKKLTGGYDNQYLNTQHDYIFIYTKRKSDFAITLEEKESKYKLTDSKGRKFKWDSLWNVGGLQYSKSLDYPIKAPDGSDIWPIGKKGVAFWLWSKDKVDKNRDELKFKKDRNGNWRVYKKVYASEGIVPGSILDKNKVKGNTYSSREMKNIFGWKIFDYAKPTPLLKYLITRGTNLSSNDIVLDFFAGAGTTAQAVMEQNAEDGGNRKWICIQLPELCEEDSEAFKAGYKNIAEIAKERIRRAGKKIEKENKEKVDTGFKSFKLDKSNFKIWKGKIKNKEDLIGQMEMFIDNVKENSTEENILHELILKSGLELDVDIKEKEFKTPASAKASAGKEKYYSLAEGRLLVYLGDNISIEMGEYLQSQKPEKIICMERAFQNDDNLKTNILLQAEQEGIDFKVI
jgi:adenine-specific DNA-methyltransferase